MAIAGTDTTPRHDPAPLHRDARDPPLSAQTRRTYESKVRQYLAWLAAADLDGDPFKAEHGRDWAVRDYRTHLRTALKRAPATVNGALAAVDDLYLRRGLGPAKAARAELPTVAPRALEKRHAIRFLRAVERSRSPRDRALTLTPFYAGTRLAETVALDLDDVRLSARKGILRVAAYGQPHAGQDGHRAVPGRAAQPADVSDLAGVAANESNPLSVTGRPLKRTGCRDQQPVEPLIAP